MKKGILSGLLMSVLLSSFSQQNTPSPVSTRQDYQDYLTKAKTQKRVAKGLLIGGGAVVATAILILAPATAAYDNKRGILSVAAVGGVLALGSIPFFIVSGRNKRKAMKATTYISVEKVSYIKEHDMAFRRYPAVDVRLSF